MPDSSAPSPHAGLASQATLAEKPWGRTAQGIAVSLYTLTNDALEVTLSNYGARVVGLQAPDRNGHATDIVLGYDSLAQYESDVKQYFGATIGRFANRIAHGSFALHGLTYQVPRNNGPNALHGGPDGFDRRVWEATIIPDGVEMRLLSPDGDMGFPGDLSASVRFTLRGHDLVIEYRAETSKETVINLTNHSYFNLAGESSGTVLAQSMRVAADRYTPVNGDLIPTGSLEPVAATPLDLRDSTTIGKDIAVDHPQIQLAGGYDHNFVLGEAPGETLRFAAEAFDPSSGRSLSVATTEPGIQFYSGNFLDGSAPNKAGGSYQRNAGFCLETQHFPDSPNQPQFPSTTLRPGETFRSTTVFTFGVKA
jgi:aldose 1-epimerase